MQHGHKSKRSGWNIYLPRNTFLVQVCKGCPRPDGGDADIEQLQCSLFIAS